MGKSEAIEGLYEDRLVAYVDILGWKSAMDGRKDKAVKEIIDFLVNDVADFYSKDSKEKDELAGPINPIRKEIEVTCISDSIFISMPASFEGRIFIKIAHLCIELLKRGFLARGGVTIGLLNHKNNVYGPALIEAVILEKESTYPRILCSPSLYDSYLNWNWKGSEELPSVSEDHLQRKVVNILSHYCLSPQDLLTKEQGGYCIPVTFIEDMQSIQEVISKNIKDPLISDKHKEKWTYMDTSVKTQLSLIGINDLKEYLREWTPLINS